MDYYVRLERGRTLNASESVLDAVARALMLNDTERQHLYVLARPSRDQRVPLPVQRVRPGLRRILESLTDTPAMVLGRRRDVLASNRMARALFFDFDKLPQRERNMTRWVFLEESARDLYVDWEAAARGTVAVLRMYAGRYPNDPQLAELIGELSLRDKDFRRWWAEHDVVVHTYGVKRMRHPLVGELILDYEALTVTDDPEQTLGLHTAAPGSPSEEGLRRLSELSLAMRVSS